MKSPLRKLRNIGLHKSEPKIKWDHKISVHTDGLTQAAKDMKDMRTCYDSLLSAAAATANSAYEFSESLLEMGNCLLEKTAMHDSGESRGALSLLGKLQLELQKLVDSYRTHIIMTITNPSESLLSELRKVEEMKLQCDEKREMFEYMVGQVREKGRSRHGKGEPFTSQQLEVVCEEYDDAARLCIFRVESLKQGQSRSLLTQAARHHAAQLNFFRKGYQSLEAVEPHIRNVAEKQHIDYELYELNESEKDDYEGNSFQTNDFGELSFDYRQNEQEIDNAYTLRNSMEMNSGKNQGDQILGQRHRAGSHSAPIYAEKFDPADRTREIRASVSKLSTHVLPTPADAKGSITNSSKNMWHSSPLDIEKPEKFIDNRSSALSFSKSEITFEENNSNKQHFLPLPFPPAEGAAAPQADTQSGFDTRKIKRQAFSGPLASKPSSNKPAHSSGLISTTEPPQLFSGFVSRVSGPLAPSFVKTSHSASPPLVSSPKISELHELPRPPDSFGFKPVSSVVALGHSAPLVNRNREVSPTNRNPSRKSIGGSPLPLPQLTVSRSFSIPSSSYRAAAFHSGKLLGSSQIVQNTQGVASPPLTPLHLSNMKPPNSGQIRGKVNLVS
ncbi:hypothetical protein ABFS82_06G002900 [Erythranthe guttata]